MAPKDFESIGFQDDKLGIDNPANLHVIAVFFNFNRFKNPVINFKNFELHMRSLGVTLHVVELVVGKHTPFEVTSSLNKHHLQFRTDSEFFQKENLINLGIKNAIKLYPDSEYFAWIDSDIHFFNKNVVKETLYKLNRYSVVQMWGVACDLDPIGHPLEFKPGMGISKSFAYCFENSYDHSMGYGGVVWHTGYSWAIRRQVWEELGGLYDKTVVGSADFQMAWAFVEKPRYDTFAKASKGYIDDVMKWMNNAGKVVNRNITYTNGLVHHSFHGKKSKRAYMSRWLIITTTQYDPNLDLYYDSDGLLHLTDRNPELKRLLRNYLKSRDDDDNTID